MTTAFHRALKRLLLDAFGTARHSPEAIARHLAKSHVRPCGREMGAVLKQWMQRRGVTRLIHFTSLRNVPLIVRYGLIPREYLELEAIQLALGPQFSDDYRLDRRPEYNCLSLTSPNYGMFFTKRANSRRGWAVLEFDAEVLARLHFGFSPTNSAGSEVTPLAGAIGAERLFLLPECRRTLGLASNEPTDPQAEALCDSIIPPASLRSVYVEQDAGRAWLHRQGIEAKVDPTFFVPRRDWRFWQGKRVTDLPAFRRAGLAAAESA